MFDLYISSNANFSDYSFTGDLYQDSGVEYSEAGNVQSLNEVRVNSAVPLI